MASTIKVDNVQNQPGTNIISKCSTTITLGASSDTVALASGASQTGFGRTGTVDWDTSIHTGTVTAATGKGYFVNTTSGGITVNLPAGAVGSIVAVSDYASTAASNNITVTPNGSENINGTNDNYDISTAGLAVTLVYADATRGWKSVTGSDADATGVTKLYVTGTGGTPCVGAIVCTDYKTHTFTGPGAFCVSCAGNADGSNTVDYLVVAGGGGGGKDGGGGGGAGGYRESPGTASGCYTVSPRGVAPAAAIAVSATPYTITVGGGGATAPGSAAKGVSGSDSVFSTITSAGGGGGGSDSPPVRAGAAGGSGGGARAATAPAPESGGAGDTPPAPVAQGMAGGSPSGPCYRGSGGGGATVAGCGAPFSPTCTPHCTGGRGGTGATTHITASPVAYAGGGSGGGNSPSGGGAASPCGTGGAGGPPTSPPNASPGTINRGGGGGGDNTSPGSGQAGGSGVVIIRYKFQN